MSYLEELPVEGAVADLYAVDEQRQGYVANYTRVFARRPEVYAAWQQLNAAIRAGMDPVHYEVATVAAAQELRSSYCVLAHGEVLAAQLGAAEVLALVGRQPEEVVGETVAAVDALARKVASSPADVAADDLERLRRLGLSDSEVLDVVLAAAARCFFSSVLEATGAEPDAAYLRLPEVLRAALTVGRPIEAGR